MARTACCGQVAGDGWIDRTLGILHELVLSQRGDPPVLGVDEDDVRDLSFPQLGTGELSVPPLKELRIPLGFGRTEVESRGVVSGSEFCDIIGIAVNNPELGGRARELDEVDGQESGLLEERGPRWRSPCPLLGAPPKPLPSLGDQLEVGCLSRAVDAPNTDRRQGLAIAQQVVSLSQSTDVVE